ncbi:cobalamin B12-binding domain-containing protein [Acidithrix ferrooxidans]|uniref:Methylmalonyl-CoA mutase large subunit n=1 Tax=Acidithrix ferrooxidans TaxID=1280514 RepID=A0A0D8HH99_9ACTN|nr:cobalamin-dependent protein [Acidithrix ferrooxidans]KJF17157.1 methylmalonyl-CoA mutase large subunit [Acidithrix ferrooxidans]
MTFNQPPPYSPRVVMAKTSLDGHWRGITIVEHALREAGFEIVLLGMATRDEIMSAVIQEDPDLVGLNVGGRLDLVLSLVDEIAKLESPPPVIVGGIITPSAKRTLEALGVDAFPPGSKLTSIVEAAKRLTNFN